MNVRIGAGAERKAKEGTGRPSSSNDDTGKNDARGRRAKSRVENATGVKTLSKHDTDTVQGAAALSKNTKTQPSAVHRRDQQRRQTNPPSPQEPTPQTQSTYNLRRRNHNSGTSAESALQKTEKNGKRNKRTTSPLKPQGGQEMQPLKPGESPERSLRKLKSHRGSTNSEKEAQSRTQTRSTRASRKAQITDASSVPDRLPSSPPETKRKPRAPQTAVQGKSQRNGDHLAQPETLPLAGGNRLASKKPRTSNLSSRTAMEDMQNSKIPATRSRVSDMTCPISNLSPVAERPAPPTTKRTRTSKKTSQMTSKAGDKSPVSKSVSSSDTVKEKKRRTRYVPGQFSKIQSLSCELRSILCQSHCSDWCLRLKLVQRPP